jgi:hypothetical protein
LALGKARFAESSTLGKERLSANTFYAEGSALGTNRPLAKPQLRKRPMYAVIFAESQLLGSRQIVFLFFFFLRREPQPKLSVKRLFAESFRRLSTKYIFFGFFLLFFFWSLAIVLGGHV